jgi:SAF domain-containing protein
MTTIQHDQQRARTSSNGDGHLRLASTSRQRNIPWVIVGVLLVVGGALGFSVLAIHLADRQPVLALGRAVPAGQVIRDADLKVVRISVDGQLRGLPASQRNQVVGRPAAADLAADTLLTRTDVGTGTGLGPGKAIVGLGLKTGQLPSEDLGPGARVLVLDTGEATGGGRSEPVVLSDGRVTSVKKQDAGVGAGTVAVSVVVDKDKAPAIAAANASGRAALVLVSQ